MKEHSPYFLRALLIGLLVVPVVTTLAPMPLFMVGIVSPLPAPLFLGIVDIVVWAIFLWRYRKKLPDTWFARLLPVVIAPCYYLLVWSLTLALGKLSIASFWHTDVFFILTLPWAIVNIYYLFSNDPMLFVYTQLLALVCPLVVLAIVQRLPPKTAVTAMTRSLIILSVAVCLVCATPFFLMQLRSAHYITLDYQIEAVGSEYTENNLARIDEVPFVITENYPRLDGATAAYPVYAALAQAFYQGLDEYGIYTYVSCNTTPVAYQRLIDGEVDLIFGAQPSKKQQEAAAAQGVDLEMTVVGREAFVFFVNRDNPVDNLTIEQIQDIYQGKITNWSQLGGLDEPILAFQRPEDSGSQTIMLAAVMGDKPMAAPLRHESVSGMGGIIDEVAEYRNYSSAIGYSFRYYSTGMHPNNNIRLVSINGIAPTVENIQNGSYPFTIDVYAITAGTTNPHVPELLDWLTSNQGQAFIEQSGYVARPSS